MVNASYRPRSPNHGLAGALGAWINTLVEPGILRWGLGLSFLAMALWTLVPDTLDDRDTRFAPLGVFGTTLIAFFLAEMGDKTQVATVALAAQYQAMLAVVAGTTFGMAIANIPVVYFGERIAGRFTVRIVHRVAAALFATIGVATLAGAGSWLGWHPTPA